MSTISVIDNKIKVIPSELLVITIIKKVLINNILDDVQITITDSLDTPFTSNELEDGVYQVLLSSGEPTSNIVFIISNINEQKALFSIDCIKTNSKFNQRNYNNYYDLIAFSIQYDRLIQAINYFNSLDTNIFTDIDIINYFDTITKYFKYDTI
jgi:hypothetical protein